MRLIRIIGNFQARVILTIVYLILVVPIGLLRRAAGDPLKSGSTSTGWAARTGRDPDPSSARKQY